MPAGTALTIVVRLPYAALLFLACACSAGAHPLSVSYARFSLETDLLSATVRLPMDDMDLLLTLDTDLDGTVSEQELAESAARIAAYLDQHIEAAIDGHVLKPELLATGRWLNEARFPYLEARLEFPYSGTAGAVDLQATLLTDLYADHRMLAEIDLGREPQQFVFQGGNRWHADRDTHADAAGFWSFFKLGVVHIATGFDHLLFLLGLLLAGRNARDLVAVVTAFTVAHSATLALAVLNVVNPPALYIECAIALSIVYVGVENALSHHIRHRWRLAAAFGLVHGFGFAVILRELTGGAGNIALSLFSFNLGVEAGQLVVVVAVLPVLLAARRLPGSRTAAAGLSWTIAACGMYWFVQRAAGL